MCKESEVGAERGLKARFVTSCVKGNERHVFACDCFVFVLIKIIITLSMGGARDRSATEQFGEFIRSLLLSRRGRN